MILILTLPLPPKGLRPNDRCFWAKRARLTKTAREQGRRAMFVAMQQIESPVFVIRSYTIQAFFKTTVLWDSLNIVASVKALEDGIADAAGQNDRTFECLGVTHRAKDKDNPRLEIHILIEELI